MPIRRSPRFIAASCTAIALAALSACTVGPDYRGAPPIAADAIANPTFVRAPSTGIVATAPTASAWWQALGDAQLDALIEAALAHNPDVHVAQARLREARAQLVGTRANELPKVSVDAAAVRMRSPDLSALASGGSGSTSGKGGGSTGRGPLQLYTAGLDASWEIDLFGGTRRSIEAASDEADALESICSGARAARSKQRRTRPTRLMRISPTRKCRWPPKWRKRISTCATDNNGSYSHGNRPNCSSKC